LKRFFLLLTTLTVACVAGFGAGASEEKNVAKQVVAKYAPGADFSKPVDILIEADAAEEAITAKFKGEEKPKVMLPKTNVEIRLLARGDGSAYRFSAKSVVIGPYTRGLSTDGKPWLVAKGALAPNPGDEAERSTARVYASLAGICCMAPLAVLKPPADEPGPVEELKLFDEKILKVRPVLLANDKMLTSEVLLAAGEPTLLGARLRVDWGKAFALFANFQKQGEFTLPLEWTLSKSPGDKPFAKVTIKRIQVLRGLPDATYSKENSLRSLDELIKPKEPAAPPQPK
jgi:hypothetical protein